MRKTLLLLCSTVFLFGHVLAQSHAVSGKVTDEKGSPVANASVVAKGLSLGTTTGKDGNFSLTIPDNVRSLIISAVTMEAVEIVIGTKTTFNVSLKPADKNLQEVVVVGYGTKLKREVTGSIATVGAKEIANTPATSFETAIQGRAAGVFVSQQNGKLGQGINIRVRGASSVTAGNEPLYVIDGIPVTTDNLSSNGAPTNALSDFNMNDIESIQILKDASSTAIYGASASNGVVLITTKKGKAGTSRIDFSFYTGSQKPTGNREFMNSNQYVAYETQAAMGAANQDFLRGLYPTLAAAQAAYTSTVNSRLTRYSAGNNDWQTGKVFTDWQQQAYQHAPVSQYDLNLSGGSDKTKFYISGQYLDQTGIIVRNSLNRYSTRINIDHQMKDWLTVGVNLSFAKTNNYRVSNDNAFATPLQLVALSPITPLIDPRTGLASGALDLATGNPNTKYPVYYNPLLSVLDASYKTFVNRTFGTAYARIIFTKNLSFRSEFGLHQLNQVEETYSGKLTSRNSGVPNGTGSYLTTLALNYTTNNYFDYKRSFGLHDVDVVAGMSFTSRQIDYSNAAGQAFPSDAYQKLINAATKSQASTSSTSNTLLSYFSRVAYSYNSKYLLNFTARIDGSSRVGPNQRYGAFYGISGGWIITQEPFMNNISWLNSLKLKAGYAGNGNDRISDFAAKGLFSGNAPYGGQAGQHPTQLPNPDLKWETTYGSDIGLEAAIVHNRITIELDYYDRETRDLLLNREVPGTSGFAIQTQNVG